MATKLIFNFYQQNNIVEFKLSKSKFQIFFTFYSIILYIVINNMLRLLKLLLTNNNENKIEFLRLNISIDFLS